MNWLSQRLVLHCLHTFKYNFRNEFICTWVIVPLYKIYLSLYKSVASFVRQQWFGFVDIVFGSLMFVLTIGLLWRMGMMKISEITTPPTWKYQLKATHGSSINDEETLTPLDRLQLAQKITFYIGKTKLFYISQQHKVTKSEKETRHTEAGNFWLGTGAKNVAGLNCFNEHYPPFLTGHCEKITLLKLPKKNQLKKI